MAQPENVVRFLRGAAGAGASDAELVERYTSARDESAFRALVARYGPTVWAVCLKVLRDHHAAEDAFQAAFLVFARKASGLRAGAAVGSWLHAVAYRVAARVRAARRTEPGAHEPADRRPDALHALSAREAESALHEELAGLPEKYRGPLVLCCLDGLSRDEAAARLGWPVNRVKHGLERGRELLRVRLTRRGLALGLTLTLNLLSRNTDAAPPAVVEVLIAYTRGAVPPTAIDSLVNGVTRTMWTAQWKWLVAGCGALVLAVGSLAAVLHTVPPAGPVVPPGAPLAVPARESKAPIQSQGDPGAPWAVAAEYLQLVIDGRPDRARALGDKRFTEQNIEEVQTAGLKRVKFTVLLLNDLGAAAITERVRVKRPNADPVEGHVQVSLERAGAGAPWRVTGSHAVEAEHVWGPPVPDGLRFNDYYLLNGNDDIGGPFPEPKGLAPGAEPAWHIASEFMNLARTEKTADALKRTAPGTVSEKRVGELRALGGTSGSRPVAVLLNDTRVEVVFELWKVPDRNKTKHGHAILMLTRSGGAWRVKDIDFRATKDIRARAEPYLRGAYNEPLPKK